MTPESRRRRNSNRRGFLSILGGTAAGQIAALAAAPLLTRIYSPTDFGIFATCAAIVVTIGTVAAGRYELAIPLPSEERHAQSLAFLGLISASLVGLVCTLAVALGGTRVATLFGQPALMPWLWAVPVSVTAMGFSVVLTQLAVRHSRFGTIGRRNALQQLSMVLAQTAGGGAGLRPGGLVFGFAVSYVISALSLLAGSHLRGAEARQGRKSLVLKAVLRRYWRFPVISGMSGLLNVLALQVPVLLLAYWYGAQVAGWMSLTQRVLALPVTLIGVAVGQVFLAQFVVAVRSDVPAAARMFVKATLGLAVAASVISIVLLTLGPWLFPVVFGTEWSESGLYARAMSISLACQLVAAPLSQTLIALERQKTQLIWDFARVAAVVTAVGTAHAADRSPLVAVWAIAAVLTLGYIVSWGLSYSAIRTALRK